MSSNLVSDIDIRRAVDEEASWHPDLIPPNLASIYAEKNGADTADLIAEVAQAPLDIHRAQVLAASKWRYGRRPVALLPLQERILYRAVVNRIDNDLPEVVRGSTAHSDFEKAPVDDGAAYIVVTDIANYYSSIPLKLLAKELLERCGRWEPVKWLHSFWQHIGNGLDHGIPQVSDPSDRVAEAYIDELHRRLLRRGLHVWRYADDFRISASSRSVAIDALELFDEEARNLGLFVNERKTYIPNRSKYEEHRRAEPGNLPEIEIDKDLSDVLAADPYENLDDNARDLSELTSSARHLLEQLPMFTPDGAELPIAKQLQVASALRKSLRILGSGGDDAALRHCHRLLEQEPQLTPSVAAYLIDVIGFGAFTDAMASSTVSEITRQVPLTTWQRYWILYVLGGRSEALPPLRGDEYLTSWVRSNLSNGCELVRSQALWALAQHEAVTREEMDDAAADLLDVVRLL
jgi:hypothetical protein